MMKFTATLETGERIESTPRFADKMAFEQYLANRNLGNIATNAFRMQGFCAWRAAKREGSYSGTLDDFMNALIDLDVTDVAAESDSDDTAELEGVELGKDGLAAQQTS